MANVKITLDYQIDDGMSLTFKAPCDCTAVTGLKVYYPSLTEETSTSTSKTFTFKDAHRNDLSNIGNLFVTGAYVKVILDTINGYAYIQNADTNGYIENTMAKKTDVNTALNGKAPLSHTHDAESDLTGVLPVDNGGTGVDNLEALKTALGVIKVATGSYVGTGAGTTLTLTFDFTPRVVFVSSESASNNHSCCTMINNCEKAIVNGHLTPSGSGGSNNMISSLLNVTWGENNVTWENSYGRLDLYNLNHKDCTYKYVAIG